MGRFLFHKRFFVLAALAAAIIGTLTVVAPQSRNLGAKEYPEKAIASIRSRGSSVRVAANSRSVRKLGLITGYTSPGVFLLDPDTNTVSGPILADQIDAANVTSAAITPDGLMAIVADRHNGDPDRGILYFIDLADLSAPVLLGTAAVSFEPYHLCFTPDGKYGIVTGGYSSPGWGEPWGYWESFSVSSRTLFPVISAGSYEDHFAFPNAAVAADGQTALVTDCGYGIGAVVYRLDPSSGQLTYQSSLLSLLPSFSYPRLVAISPDGQTVIVDAPGVSLSVLRIDSPCNLVLTGNIYSSYYPISIGFSPGGKNAYLLGESSLPDAFVHILNVKSRGVVEDSGINIPINWPISTHPDSLAIEPQGRYAYVGGSSMAVIDLKDKAQIGTLAPGAKTISFPSPILVDIGVTKYVDNLSPCVEDTISFTITAKNNGPRDAAGVRVSDRFPAGLSYVSHSTTDGSYDPATGLWNLGNLEQEISAVLSVRAKVEQTGLITNTARIQNVNGVDPESSNDAASVTVEADFRPDFSNPQLNHEAVDKITAHAGQTLTFTISYDNSGGRATGVAIANPIDAALESIQPLDGGVISGGQVVWNVGKVAANASGSVRFQAAVKMGAPRGIKITSQATIDSDQTSPIAMNTVFVTVL